MLVSLGRRDHGPTNLADPVRLLLECHERIRRFGALAARLADPGLSSSDVIEAATVVRRYFEVALPLHVLDEDCSLRPLFEARGADPDLREALDRMASEHVEIEARIGRLGPSWKRLAEGEAASDLRAVAAGQGQELLSLLERHLQIEETRIFPRMAALLAEPERVILLEQIRARRS